MDTHQSIQAVTKGGEPVRADLTPDSHIRVGTEGGHVLRVHCTAIIGEVARVVIEAETDPLY